VSNLIGTTVMCPECGGWNTPGHPCRTNPYQDIANALAREVCETDALKLRLVEAAKELRDQRSRCLELEGAFQEFATHGSWRCNHYDECHCGLDDLCDKLGIPRISKSPEA